MEQSQVQEKDNTTAKVVTPSDKIEHIYKLTTSFQERIQELENKGLNATIEKNKDLSDLSKKVADLMQMVQNEKNSKKLEEKIAKQQEEINGLYADQKRLNAGKNEEEEHAYIKQYRTYLKKGYAPSIEDSEDFFKSVVKPIYPEYEERDIYAAVKTLQTGVGPDGGYFIVPERLSQTVTRDFEIDPIRVNANVVNTATSFVEMIIDDEEIQDIQTPSELETRPEGQNNQIGVLQIYVHELEKTVATSTKMIDTYPRAEEYLMNKITRKISREENKLFLVGTGAGEPKGILSYDKWTTNGTYERDKLEYINSGVDGQFESTTLIDLWSSLHEAYQPGAKFYTTRANFGSIMQLRATDEAFLFDRRSFLRDGTSKVLLGTALEFSPNFERADGSTAGIKAMMYGDLSLGYTIVDQTGIRILRDPYTKNPKVLIRMYKRVGGAVTSYDALKIYQLSA